MCIKFCAQDIFFFALFILKFIQVYIFAERERKKDWDWDWDWDRERERKTETETETHRETETETETDRQTDRQRQRDTDKQRDRQRDRENKITEDQCSNSNINEVIKTVLNSVFFFVTKRFPMHKKHQKTQKHNQAKAQNTNKWTK